MKTASAITTLLQALLWLGVSMGTLGAEVWIKNVDEFIQLKNNVSNGNYYSGTTVFLDSDIDLTGKTLEPIGNKNNYFRGVFDGQGHAISNLKMTSSLKYVGLFGYSKGLAIRNLILDSSCSIASTFSGSNTVFVGGIIGCCETDNEPCNIENSMNMGIVTFSGTISGSSLILGGIAGYLSYSSYSYGSAVKNCANYGDVTHSGTSGYSYIGGIIGYSRGSSSSKRVYIYNSLNHGTITHNGTTTTEYLYLGGIVGISGFTTIENCVSGGKISTNNSTYTGSIAGWISSDTSINYCYYTSYLSGYTKLSGSFSYDSTTFELSGTVSVGSYSGKFLIGTLNAAADYYTLRDYSNWLLNKEKKAVSFTVNRRTNSIKMDYQIILLPSLASEGNVSFDGWYEDNGLTTPLASYEITNNTDLYEKFGDNLNNYTITFDTKVEGVSVAPITAPFGTVVTLPSGLSKEHCDFTWWENKYGDKIDFNLTMRAHNITLYAVWKCTHIKTPDDFIDFSKVVNNGGNNYSGTTVFLDSDIDFTGETFEPIGTSYYFSGIFDGQGHVISSLKMNSSSVYVGLFGYSRGLTIRNVILDSSCSIASTFSGSNSAYVGGIIVSCDARNGHCTIENSVNMGNVTFSGAQSGDRLYLGGIAGTLSSSKYESIVKNCANYGDVTHSGTSDVSWIGGVVGYSYRYSSSSYRVYIYNSLNHGTITHNGTTTSGFVLGGIAGFTYQYTTIENCVSGGGISSTKSGYIGSIVGSVFYSISIKNCYFTSDLSGYGKYGSGTPSSESNIFSYNITTFVLSGTVSIGSYSNNSLIDALNTVAGYYTFRDYSHWLLDKDNKDVSFIINERSTFTLNSQIILLPSLASEGRVNFDGWYKDKEFTTPFTSYDITEYNQLYGLYGVIFTLTFEANGGKVSSSSKRVALSEKYGDLPEVTKTGYTFVGWFTGEVGGEKIEADTTIRTAVDHTLYAHWEVNNYTVTFEGNEGTPFQQTKEVTYDSTYGELPEPTKIGYDFTGWYTEEGDEIEPTTVVKITKNTTLCPHWVPYGVTVTFDAIGGSSSQSSKTVIFDDAYGDLPEATRTGYTFIGWFTEAEGGEEVKSGDIVKITEGQTLYARWSINKYTITFEMDGGSECENITQDYNTEMVLPKPTKTGYTFDCWCSDSELSIEYTETTMPAGNVTLYAKWNINHYTLTFDFGNGTTIEEIVNYNDPITYPADPVKDEHIFVKWNNTFTFMPAHDLAITAQWLASSKGMKSSSLAVLIVGVVVPIIVIVIALIVVLVFVSWKKRNDETELRERRFELSKPLIEVPTPVVDEYSRVIASSNDEVDGRIPKKSAQSVLSYLYPKDYARPTMKEALTEADFTEKRTEMICSACENAARIIADEGRLFEGFTKEDAAAVAMYTYDFGYKEFENNPYRIVNRSLAGRNYAELQKARGLLYLVMTALRKLPRYTEKMLYRAVRGEVNLDEDHYYCGNVVTWPALSSTSPDMNTTKTFLAKGSKTGDATGTLFIIDKGWGYDIQPYSLFPDEEEILLEPERQFKVTSVISSSDLTVINLEMLDTPLSLPEVFGSGRK